MQSAVPTGVRTRLCQQYERSLPKADVRTDTEEADRHPCAQSETEGVNCTVDVDVDIDVYVYVYICCVLYIINIYF